MKELSIEEKARRYDEVLAMAKECITYIPDDAVNKYMLNMFPEIIESEDERIRKELICFLETEIPQCNARDKYITWLEKQGENHIVNNNEMVKNVETIKVDNADKKELKIVPKFMIGDTMRTLQEASNGVTSGLPVVVSIDDEYYHCTNELIAIKDQDDYEYQPMNRSTAWGKEDEMRYINLIRLVKYSSENDVTKESFIKFINKLKSFKDRYTWKPSDEQINALELTLQYNQVSHNSVIHLNSLFNDLNKLREG